MTYSSASEWCENHVPKENFDDFDAWLDYCINNKLETPQLYSEPEFIDLMEQYWNEERGEEEIEDIPEIPSRVTEIESRQQPEQIIRERPRIITMNPQALDLDKPTVIVLPPTGKAPEIPKPILIMPTNIPIQEKQSFFSKIVSLFRRKK